MGLATAGAPASVAAISRRKKIANTATSDRSPATMIRPQWTCRMALMRFSRMKMFQSIREVDSGSSTLFRNSPGVFLFLLLRLYFLSSSRHDIKGDLAALSLAREDGRFL